MAQGVAGNGGVELLPVEEVFADGVAPVHVSPFRAVGIILEVEVVLAVLVYHTVGVVHPSVGRGEMICGTVEVGIGDIPGVAELHLPALEGQCVGFEVENLDCSGKSVAETEGHVVVDLVLSQADVHPRVGGIVGVEHHLTLGLVFLHGQEEVLSGVVDVDDGGVAVALDVHCLGTGGLRSREREGGCDDM